MLGLKSKFVLHLIFPTAIKMKNNVILEGKKFISLVMISVRGESDGGRGGANSLLAQEKLRNKKSKMFFPNHSQSNQIKKGKYATRGWMWENKGSERMRGGMSEAMTHQFLRLSLASSWAPTSNVIPLLLGGVLLILPTSRLPSCTNTHTH